MDADENMHWSLNYTGDLGANIWSFIQIHFVQDGGIKDIETKNTSAPPRSENIDMDSYYKIKVLEFSSLDTA